MPKHQLLAACMSCYQAAMVRAPRCCRKKVEINWRKLDPKLQGVNGLDDLMSFDLRHFCRRMQPPLEAQYRYIALALLLC